MGATPPTPPALSGASDKAGSPRPLPAFVRELDTLVRARYPLVHLASWEEQRLDVILEDLAKNHGKALYFWTATQGLRRIQGARYVPPLDGTKDPVEALSAVQKLTDPSLVVLKDFHPFLNDPIVVRWVRELSYHLKTTYTTLVLLSPGLSIPTELEKDMSELMRAIAEAGCEAVEQSELRTEDGRRHRVLLVVKDEQGTQVGVKLDPKTGVATFVGHDGKDKRATALAHRVAQRYAYSKVLDELKRKGYQVAKEEKQKDGTIKLVAQRWR